MNTRASTPQLPEIRLDDSRPFSTVHGERNPGDPHYYVHFMQGGLPFGADKTLVPDDGKDAPWREAIEREDGTTRQVIHMPLYTKDMRAKVERMVKKLAARMVQRPVNRAQVQNQDMEDDDEVAGPDEMTFGPDEINLISWLRGEIDYPPNEIFAACKKRFNKVFSTKRAVIEDLVYDRNPPLIQEAELSPALLAILDAPPAQVAA